MNDKTFNQTLGSLEKEIMEIMWDLKSSSVRPVLNMLKKKRKVAYTTVMTVMSRLAKKGLLKRKLDNGSYVYSICQCKENFLANASKKVINNLIKEFGEVAVAQFFDAVEKSDIKDLKKWQKKLKSIK